MTFSLDPVRDITGLGPRWRALEARSLVSFFTSWTWMGCLAAERFSNPWLFVAQTGGEDVGLALFNRSPTRLARRSFFLGETGAADWDALYIEHNGLLGAAECPQMLAPALTFLGNSARLVLSGVDAPMLAAAQYSGLSLRIRNAAPARFVDFTTLPPDDDALLSITSANTRSQLRRSLRIYAQHGDLRVQRAADQTEAVEMLAELAALHQASWTARGKPGAFANPRFTSFHHALIARGWERDEIDLLRITAGSQLIGCLYNFRHRSHVLSYQSGFAYTEAGAHQKPGLTAHHLAMRYYREQGIARYDFLAGHDRYKASLANGAVMLNWLDLNPRWSPRGVASRLRAA